MRSNYWNNKGKYQDMFECMLDLVPFEGPVPLAAFSKFGSAAECFRCANNLYYDWYNNGFLPGTGNSSPVDGSSYLQRDLQHVRGFWKKISEFFQGKNKNWPWKLSVWGVKDWNESINSLFEKKFKTRKMDDEEEEEMYEFFEKRVMKKRKAHYKEIKPEVCAVFEEVMDAIMRWCIAAFDELTDDQKTQVGEIARKVRGKKGYSNNAKEFKKRWMEIVPRRKSKRLKIEK